MLFVGKDIREKNGQLLCIEFLFIGIDVLSKLMVEIIQVDMCQIGVDVLLIGEEESSIYVCQCDGCFGMIFYCIWGALYDLYVFFSLMCVLLYVDFQVQ